jgi:hypothetical protein
MNKSNTNTSNLDSNYNCQKCFNDEENSLNSFKDNINHKNGSKDIQLDFIDTGISSHKKEDYINNNKVLNDNETNINLLGRKKKDSSKKNRHDKYSKDNLIKKIKTTLLTYLIDFINLLIFNIYNGDIGHDIFEMKILNIDNEEIRSSEFNQRLLEITLKEILYGTLSERYKNYKPTHNKDLIDKLLKEEDEEKRVFFNRLFNLKFIDCLKQLRGENIEQLQGFISLDKILEKYEDYKDSQLYNENIEYYIFNFEEIMTRSRTKNKKNKVQTNS